MKTFIIQSYTMIDSFSINTLHVLCVICMHIHTTNILLITGTDITMTMSLTSFIIKNRPPTGDCLHCVLGLIFRLYNILIIVTNHILVHSILPTRLRNSKVSFLTDNGIFFTTVSCTCIFAIKHVFIIVRCRYKGLNRMITLQTITAFAFYGTPYPHKLTHPAPKETPPTPPHSSLLHHSPI